MNWDRAALSSPSVRAAKAAAERGRPATDPHGAAIRPLLPGSTPLPTGPHNFLPEGNKPIISVGPGDDQPFLPGGVPNPAWGKKHGMVWDGTRWVQRDENADLQRQALELELEKRRRDMDDSGLGDALRGWLAKRLGDRT